MILTDKFVYIHQPKTGGTFVSTALFQLHGARWNRFAHLRYVVRRQVVTMGPHGSLIYRREKHSTCEEMPLSHSDKPVLATVRNPYDWYVSQYEFGWWKRAEFLRYFRAVPDFEDCYPDFPNISFADYVELSHAAFSKLAPEQRAQRNPVGRWTQEFVMYYCRDPRSVLTKMDDAYFASGSYRSDLFNVSFINTNQLNRGLYEFLLRMGYQDEDINFVLDLGKILPGGKGRSAEQRWERYYTPELKKRVRERERFAFVVFPEFDLP